MDKPFWERFKDWWCRRFGHRSYFTSESIEICERCNRLLSTPFSRARQRR